MNASCCASESLNAVPALLEPHRETLGGAQSPFACGSRAEKERNLNFIVFLILLPHLDPPTSLPGFYR